jgi:hypothetical protein
VIKPNWYPGEKQLRQFAGISLPGFGLIGLVVVYHSDTLTLSNVFASVNAANVLWAIGAVVFFVGMILPEAIRPVYGLLMLVTLPIGWLISAFFLRLIFYGVMTPIGFFFKLTGRDPLRLRRPEGAASFWLDHRDRAELSSYFRQA